jgi:uncharacterized protein (AIM24 family)
LGICRTLSLENNVLHIFFIFPGSLLVVRLPPGKELIAKRGACIATSDQITTTFATVGTPVSALTRSVIRLPLTFQRYTASHDAPGQVVLAANAINDLAVIDIQESEGADPICWNTWAV